MPSKQGNIAVVVVLVIVALACAYMMFKDDGNRVTAKKVNTITGKPEAVRGAKASEDEAPAAHTRKTSLFGQEMVMPAEKQPHRVVKLFGKTLDLDKSATNASSLPELKPVSEPNAGPVEVLNEAAPNTKQIDNQFQNGVSRNQIRSSERQSATMRKDITNDRDWRNKHIGRRLDTFRMECHPLSPPPTSSDCSVWFQQPEVHHEHTHSRTLRAR
jgi:hypothetical protein